MAYPSSEEDGVLREWAPLTNLLQQIPLKAQRGLKTHDLNLTCVDTLPEFIAVGTNLGLVYWYNRKKGDLQRLRCENTGSAITCVKVISTVDFMVAAGNDQGIVTVFQIPKIPPDSLPESMKPKKNKQVERYTISDLHKAPITAIEWSMNGMKLFSGDKNGVVVLTEIDFYMHLSKSIELLNEKYEIVQLSYSQQLLLVSTLYRSIVCYREERLKVAQVGQKERKTLGRLGATFCLGSNRPQDLVVYASRPGLRIWLADKNGIVQQTLIYKDALMNEHTNTPLINPAPAHVRQSRGDHQFGPLLVFRENLLVTYSGDMVYVLNPASITVVATVADLRKVQDVAVNKDEIFILEGERSLVRVAYTPEQTAAIMPEMQHLFTSSTDALVHIMSSPEIQSLITDKSIPRKILWDVVVTEMKNLGFPMGDNGMERCRQKWNNIIRNYHHYVRTRKFDVKAHRPSYYNTLEEMFELQKLMFNHSSVGAEESVAVNPHDNTRGFKRKLDINEDERASKLPFVDMSVNSLITGYLSSSDLPSSSASSEAGEDNEPFSCKYGSVSKQSHLSKSESEVPKEELIIVYPDEHENSEADTAFMDDPLDHEELVTVYPNEIDYYSYTDHSYTEESSSKPRTVPSYPSCKKSETKIEINKSLVNFLQSSKQSVSKKSKDTTVIVSPKPNQPARPVPTPGEALMSLVLRLDEQEKRKERRRNKRNDARFERLEAVLEKQSLKQKELLDAAVLTLSELEKDNVDEEQSVGVEEVDDGSLVVK